MKEVVVQPFLLFNCWIGRFPADGCWRKEGKTDQALGNGKPEKMRKAKRTSKFFHPTSSTLHLENEKDTEKEKDPKGPSGKARENQRGGGEFTPERELNEKNAK